MNLSYSMNQGELEPWFAAIRVGDREKILQCLESGIDVNVGDCINSTTLHYAVAFSHLDLIRWLMERGADPTIANTLGHTAVTMALIASRTWKGLFLVKKPDPTALEILLSAGARYRLLEAVLLDDVALARRRLDEGEDPNYGHFSYHGPVLKIAAELGHREIVELLLDRGADPEKIDDIGWRPLASAARAGHTEVVRLLIDRGADIDALGWSEDSALSHAVKAGHRDIVELLREAGAQR